MDKIIILEESNSNLYFKSIQFFYLTINYQIKIVLISYFLKIMYSFSKKLNTILLERFSALTQLTRHDINTVITDL